MSHDRAAALIAGLLYFSTHISSVVAVVVYGAPSSEPARSMAPETTNRILGGVTLEVLLALGVLGTGVVLLPLLMRHGPILAQAFSALRTLEAAIIAVGVLPMLALIAVAETPAAPFAPALTALHDGAFLVGQGLIISVNTLVIATLLVRSGVVPRWIGVLGLVGGCLVLVGNAGQLFGLIDRDDAMAGLLAVPVFAFEISFATYLVFCGLRDAAPQTIRRSSARQHPVT